MKRRIFLSIELLLCLFIALNTTSCWNSRELDTLAIVLGVGIDKPKESGKLEMTVQVARPAQIKTPEKGGGGGGEKAYWNIKNSGDSIFSTVRGFTHVSGRKLYFPHNQILIFGHDMAEDGVQKYVDLFIRDPEFRLNIIVFVAKGTAGDILDTKSELEKIPANNIVELAESQAATSESSIVRLRDFLERLLSKTTAPIAPVIEISDEGGEKTVHVSGTAVFKNDKLAGQLDNTETRGLLWVINKIKSGIIKVDCPDDNSKVDLEIIKASGKFTPKIKDNKISMEVKIKEEGNLGDQECPENLAVPSKIKILEQEKNEAIKDEVMAALKKARELKTDIFGFGEAIHQKYPKEWKDMEGRWDEVFQDIEVEVTVDAKIDLTGQINKPVSPEQE